MKTNLMMLIVLLLLNTNTQAQKLQKESANGKMHSRHKPATYQKIMCYNASTNGKRTRSTSQRLIGIAERNNLGVRTDSAALHYNNTTYGFVPSNSYDNYIVNDYVGDVNTPDFINNLFTSTLKELADQELYFNNANTLTDSVIHQFGTNHKLQSMYSHDLSNYKDSTITYYNANEKPIQRRYVYNDLSTVANWMNYSREFYNYNSSNLIDDIFWQDYDTLNGIWLDAWHDSMYYTGSDLTLIQSVFFDSTSMNWVPISKVELTYNVSGKPLTQTRSEFDGTIWEFESRDVYTYNASNQLITSTYDEWISGAWHPITKDSLVYTSSSMPALAITLDWDSVTNNWKNKFKQEAQYNADEQLLLQERYTWNNSTSNWDTGGNSKFYYGNNSSLNVTDAKLSNSIMVYPSPARQTLYVANENGTIKQITITDICGNTILNQINSESKIDISRLNKGIYLLTATIDNKQYHTKFIKD